MSIFKSNPTPSGVARQLVTFSCFAKEKVTKKKATPARSPFGVPCDPLRGHVLKHIRQNSLTSLRYSAAHRGKKSENQEYCMGTWCPCSYATASLTSK
jgi:hypothetical protein